MRKHGKNCWPKPTFTRRGFEKTGRKSRLENEEKISKAGIKKINKLTVPIIRTSFGGMLKLPMPEDCDVVIFCMNDGTGLVPIRLFLPHQVYAEYLIEMQHAFPGRTFLAIPAPSKDYIEITKGESFVDQSPPRGNHASQIITAPFTVVIDTRSSSRIRSRG